MQRLQILFKLRPAPIQWWCSLEHCFQRNFKEIPRLSAHWPGDSPGIGEHSGLDTSTSIRLWIIPEALSGLWGLRGCLLETLTDWWGNRPKSMKQLAQGSKGQAKTRPKLRRHGLWSLLCLQLIHSRPCETLYHRDPVRTPLSYPPTLQPFHAAQSTSLSWLWPHGWGLVGWGRVVFSIHTFHSGKRDYKAWLDWLICPAGGSTNKGETQRRSTEST